MNKQFINKTASLQYVSWNEFFNKNQYGLNKKEMRHNAVYFLLQFFWYHSVKSCCAIIETDKIVAAQYKLTTEKLFYLFSYINTAVTKLNKYIFRRPQSISEEAIMM